MASEASTGETGTSPEGAAASSRDSEETAFMGQDGKKHGLRGLNAGGGSRGRSDNRGGPQAALGGIGG